MTSETCRHPALENLGFDHDMEFVICHDCRRVLVTQGGVTMAIPALRRANAGALECVREPTSGTR